MTLKDARAENILFFEFILNIYLMCLCRKNGPLYRYNLPTDIVLNIEKSPLGVPLFIPVLTFAVKLFITVTIHG